MDKQTTFGHAGRFVNATSMQVRVEKGELELIRRLAQHEGYSSVSQFVYERLADLINEARERFPKATGDYIKRGYMR